MVYETYSNFAIRLIESNIFYATSTEIKRLPAIVEHNFSIKALKMAKKANVSF